MRSNNFEEETGLGLAPIFKPEPWGKLSNKCLAKENHPLSAKSKDSLLKDKRGQQSLTIICWDLTICQTQHKKEKRKLILIICSLIKKGQIFVLSQREDQISMQFKFVNFARKIFAKKNYYFLDIFGHILLKITGWLCSG